MTEKLISSSQNPLFKKFASLTSSSGIKKEGLFLVSGKKLVEEILSGFLKNPSFPLHPAYQITKADISPFSPPPGLKLENKKLPLIVQLSNELFREVDVLGTNDLILVCEIPEKEASDFTNSAEGLEVIAPLQDPQNMGALIRSCAAFGVQKIHLTKESCNPFLPKAIKAASNGILHVNFSHGPGLADLSIDTDPVLVLDKAGASFESFLKDQKEAWKGYLLIGEEGQGIEKVQHQLKKTNWVKISIPMRNIESLNVVVASSILLHSWLQTSKSF